MVECMPVPVALPATSSCVKCGESPCYGHYSQNPSRVVDCDASPVPSITIGEEFSANETLTEEKCQKLAKQLLLKPVFVQHHWAHLKQIKKNRAKGVEKAKKTRAAKKIKWTGLVKSNPSTFVNIRIWGGGGDVFLLLVHIFCFINN